MILALSILSNIITETIVNHAEVGITSSFFIRTGRIRMMKSQPMKIIKLFRKYLYVLNLLLLSEVNC